MATDMCSRVLSVCHGRCLSPTQDETLFASKSAKKTKARSSGSAGLNQNSTLSGFYSGVRSHTSTYSQQLLAAHPAGGIPCTCNKVLLTFVTPADGVDCW
jgi:hypothetical protein